jgi:RimJ/RimL family protein N-acetyltransferase
MVTTRTLQVTPPEGAPLYLAPYGGDEVAEVWPFDTQNLMFPQDQIEALDLCTLEFFTSFEQYSHYTEWGMYTGEISPASFLGTVSLSMVNHGSEDSPRYMREIQEVGTHIMRPDARGKGIGTLAKLALVSHTLQDPGVYMLQAMTSVGNHAAQRSLAKVGFTQFDTFDYFNYPHGHQTQLWLLSRPEMIAAASDYPQRQAELAAGWARYEAQAATLTVEQIK